MIEKNLTSTQTLLASPLPELEAKFGVPVDALLAGKCSDLFSCLGMHEGPDSDKKIVRVFLPGAEAVEVMSATGRSVLGKLRLVHEQGIFCGEIKRKTFSPYCLKVRYPLVNLLLDDPYRFPPQLSETDLYLFNQGKQERAYTFLGANHHRAENTDGVLFAVWAPNASRVAVVGDFNSWDERVHVLRKHHQCGVWEIFIPGDLAGNLYKFHCRDSNGVTLPLKADPYAQQMQPRPDTASKIKQKKLYIWHDDCWMKNRAQHQSHTSAISIYEVHLGSWRRKAEGQQFLTYQELAESLIPYVKELGFTHIQLMPINEHPFDGSWGYQTIGMFAPTSRFGDPDGLRHFIDYAHQNGIGVLLDWVPGHFPTDEHGLSQFDGSFLYEHEDPRKGFHPDWRTLIFNYDRAEIVSYLLSNAIYWLVEFHLDGLRFDAVASMLYLDYSRKEGEWITNMHGGRENLEAIRLLRLINERAYQLFPDIMMIAEESTAWPGVTHYTDQGGLGFGFKWNLGWMNDTLRYMSRDPVHRQFHSDEMSFGIVYAYTENYILPLSHDEVVHGKRSLLEKMPGDDWQKFANLRAYLAFMWTYPGKKLLFMGGEFAQRTEWNHDKSLDWHLLGNEPHRGIQALVKDLNRFYHNTHALYQLDYNPAGFAWLELNHFSGAVFIYARFNEQRDKTIIVAVNLTPTVYNAFRVGVPLAGRYRECINTNSEFYGGTGDGNLGMVNSMDVASHGRPCSITITLPPLAAVIFEHESAV